MRSKVDIVNVLTFFIWTSGGGCHEDIMVEEECYICLLLVRGGGADQDRIGRMVHILMK